MKHIHEFLVNNKIVNKIDQYAYHPQNNLELAKIVEELLTQGITDLNCIDTSKITNMSHTFYMIDDSTDIDFDISDWDVSNVTNMESMFMYCSKFNCDLSNWNMSNVKNTNMMFSNCTNFNQDLSNWDVSNIKNSSMMFANCDLFEGNGIENWNVTNVVDASGMFYNCTNFNKDLNNWDVHNMKNINNMFHGCEKFKGTNTNNWKFNHIKLVRMQNTFINCKNKPKWY
ncbi:MAG: BspA family leucine-rich repeat surface protein [Clostridia bacterium]|nr:BspA family leucine-rich repeat surface protein [Clostridia bacterium]